MTNNKKFWLIKSEPSTYSIDDLKKDTVTSWTGIRNYQVRNFIRDEMKKGDLCLFYHSSSLVVGVSGVCKVVSDPYADETQFEKNSEYFDPNSTREKFAWYCVDVKFVKKFKNLFTLKQIKEDKKLTQMVVVKKGSRLSVQPVTEKDFEHILSLNT